MSEDIQEVLMIIVKALSVFLIAMLIFSVVAIEVNKKPLEERERMLSEMRTKYQNATKVNNNLPESWPPKMNRAFPDIELVDQEGVKFLLSDLKGRVIVLELVDMASPLSQAYAGARKKGVYGAPDQKVDDYALPFSDLVEKNTPGKRKVPNQNLVIISFIIKDEQGQQPDLQDAKNWATHFGLSKEAYHIVAINEKDFRGRESDKITPGFQLIDKNLLLRVDSAGPEPKHNLTMTLIPLLDKLLQ